MVCKGRTPGTVISTISLRVSTALPNHATGPTCASGKQTCGPFLSRQGYQRGGDHGGGGAVRQGLYFLRSVGFPQQSAGSQDIQRGFLSLMAAVCSDTYNTPAQQENWRAVAALTVEVIARNLAPRRYWIRLLREVVPLLEGTKSIYHHCNFKVTLKTALTPRTLQ